MDSVALTDKNNLFGSLEFSNTLIQKKIKPIHGATLKLKSIFRLKDEAHEKYNEILLLAKDEIGYKNLLKLVSCPYVKNQRHSGELYITIDDLASNQEGLMLLSGYLDGFIAQSILADNMIAAEDEAKKLLEIFGDRFYFEVSRHGIEDEKIVENEYIDLSIKLDIPIVATNNVLYLDKNNYNSHDVLVCIKEGCKKLDNNRKFSNKEYYFKSQEEMIDLFSDIPEAITNSYYISQRCSYFVKTREPMLPSFSSDKTLTEDDIFKQNSRMGLEEKMKFAFGSSWTEKKDEYFSRLEYELEIICKMNFAGYFLIVSDFVFWCKKNNVAVGPGRGSGAGSIVAWSLSITGLDPIEYGLIFERFLNPERISMPDFDIDFCQENRHKVIEYVRKKYGDSRVAQIITFGSMQAKAVIKDVARVMDLPYRYANYISELVPFNAVNPTTLDIAIHEVDELKQASLGFGLYHPDFRENESSLEEKDSKDGGINYLIKQVIEIALSLEGLHRHASIHAAGIVISGVDLIDYVALYRDEDSDMNVIQYSMKYAEMSGLVKFDFLGLQTLTVIAKCTELLKKKGVEVDVSNIPMNDTKTFEMLSLGKSAGVFQFEGVGIRDALKRLRPTAVSDLTALTSLYRPGPMDNLPEYISCRHGRAQPKYLHPLAQKSLEETYGVMIYQEQVLETAKILAGYSLGSADLLRRAMGKKVKSEMDAQEKMFVDGCAKNNINQNEAKEIFSTIAKFAGYGFNKSHAAAYSVISYQMAYLKANYLMEFLVSCLNLDINDHDKISLFLSEAISCGIKIIPPTINESSSMFEVRGEFISFGISCIKGVSEKVASAIDQQLRARGKFSGAIDFVVRLNEEKIINKKVLEGLILSGYFDSINKNRKELFENVLKILLISEEHKRDQANNQLSLFAKQQLDTPKDDCLLSFDEDFSILERCKNEFSVTGFFLTSHPLILYRKYLDKESILNSRLIEKEEIGSRNINIAGIIESKNSRMSGRGMFTTIKLSDEFGIFEATIFNEKILKDFSHLLIEMNIVVLECEMFKTEGGIRLTVSSVLDIEEIIMQNPNLEFSINNSKVKEVVNFLTKKRISDEILSDFSDVGFEINLLIDTEFGFRSKVNLGSKFKLDPEDIDLLKKIEKGSHN